MDLENFGSSIKDLVFNRLKKEIDAGELDMSKIDDAAKAYSREAIESVSRGIYDIILRDKNSGLKEHRALMSGFLERLNNDWGEGFDLLEIFIAISKELASDWLKDSNFVRNELTMCLMRLQARGCQVASEVLVLLRNGFADGAFARWRTLHEIAVVCLFLEKHGIEAAIRYVASDVIESYKIALKEIDCQQAMGYDGPSAHQLDIFKENVAKVKSKFGADISEQYGWASPYIGKRKVLFSDIEKDVDLDRFRRNYGVASSNVHAGVKGITFKLSLLDDSDIILAGPSNAGFVEPGHSSAISLLQINSTFLLLQDQTQAAIYISILSNMSNDIGAKLLESHVEISKRHNGSGKTVVEN